jgi:hypothetical protein
VHETWTLRALAGYRFGAARIAGESAPGIAARSYLEEIELDGYWLGLSLNVGALL